MPIEKDSLGRYVLTDSFRDFQLHFDQEKADVLIYPGHTHPAVNDRLESLELALQLDIDELETLIGTLIYLSIEMRDARRKAENK